MFWASLDEQLLDEPYELLFSSSLLMGVMWVATTFFLQRYPQLSVRR